MSDLPAWQYIRKNNLTGKWFGAESRNGPWTPIPAPQPPERLWPMPAPAPELPDPTISDRLALAMCAWRGKTTPSGELFCPSPCQDCCDHSAAVAHEVAAILRERHGGSSATADWLDGVGPSLIHL